MNDGQNNHGFLWILQTEQKWRSVFAASSDYADAAKRPKLVVTYSPMKKYFYLKDHLGNIRVTVDENGDVKGNNDYYPFGLRMPGRSMNNALAADLYKYSSKELDEESGINWYYFGARYYDPMIGRFLSIDPLNNLDLCKTPYHYGSNNPITHIDIGGLTDIEIKIKRFLETKNSTIGRIVVSNSGNDNTLHGYTLELPYKDNKNNISRIKADIYEAKLDKSKKFGEVIRLKDKNGRTNILIHQGNQPADTEGCILPGTYYKRDWVGYSRKMKKKIIDYIKNIIKKDKEKKEKTNIIVIIQDPDKNKETNNDNKDLRS